MITARALGVYYYLKATESTISADALASVFPEGRKTFLTALGELRQLGLITTTRQVVNGKYVTQSYLNGSPEKELLLQQSQQNSLLNLIVNSYISKPNSELRSREAIELEYYETEEDRLEAQRKFRERQHDEKMKAHETRRQEKMARRNPSNASGWSTTDSAFEFAEQMHDLWHIQPWQVTRSRFRYALADKRKEFNTDGAIELEMMKLFFSQIKHETKLNDPEIVWKKFILQFSNLLTEVRRLMVTPEEVAVIKDKAKKSLDWMDNV